MQSGDRRLISGFEGAAPADQLESSGWERITQEPRLLETRLHPRPARRFPYAVNQIVHKSNSRLEHDMEICVEVQSADRDHLGCAAGRAATSTMRCTRTAGSFYTT